MCLVLLIINHPDSEKSESLTHGLEMLAKGISLLMFLGRNLRLLTRSEDSE